MLIGSYIGVILAAQQFVPIGANLEYLLNLLFQVSTLVITFSSLVFIFLIQHSLDREGELASEYLYLFIELQRMKPAKLAQKENNRSTRNNPDLQLRQTMGALKTTWEKEKGIRKFFLQLTILIIVIFLLTIPSYLYVALGNWGMIWVPLGLLIVEFYNIVIVVMFFILETYGVEDRPEFSLRSRVIEKTLKSG